MQSYACTTHCTEWNPHDIRGRARSDENRFQPISRTHRFCQQSASNGYWKMDAVDESHWKLSRAISKCQRKRAPACVSFNFALFLSAGSVWRRGRWHPASKARQRFAQKKLERANQAWLLLSLCTRAPNTHKNTHNALASAIGEYKGACTWYDCPVAVR